jgi:hypothetical protein
MRCSRCGFALRDMPGEVTVVLDGKHPALYCPVCGNVLQEVFAGRGFIYAKKEQAGQFIIWDDEQTSVSFGRFTVVVTGSRVPLQDLIYTKLILLPSAELACFTPVRPEMRQFVRRCDRIDPSTNQTSAIFQIETQDGYIGKVAADCVSIPAESRIALLLWPRFRRQNWTRYYVGLWVPNFGGGRALISRVVLDIGTAAVNEVYAQLNGIPVLIELLWHNDRDDTDYLCGLMPQLEERAPESADYLTIGFDFGTSNTAAAIRYERRGAEVHTAISFSDLTLPVLAGREPPESTWLPRPQGLGAPSIPSQLFFFQKTDLRSVHEQMVPVRDYCIPFAQHDVAHQHAVGGFKWASALESTADKADIFRFLYLRLALEMVMSQTIWEHRIPDGALKLVATYPLAFEETDIRLHRESFSRVLNAMKGTIPFNLQLDWEWNESHAGENAGGKPVLGNEILMVDVGGGTTDLCISTPERKVLKQDSFEFGGENVLKALLPHTHLSSLSELQNRIRVEGSGVLDTQIYVDISAKRRAFEILRAFQAGLVEICARFIAVRYQSEWAKMEKPMSFGLLMLGNGWRLLEPLAAAAGNRELNDYILDLVLSRLEEYRVKDTLARGTISIEARYPPNPKSAVSLGAAAIDRIKELPKRNPSSHILLNMVAHSTAGTAQISWQAPVPHHLSHAPSSLILDGAGQFGCAFESEIHVFEKGIRTPIPHFDFKCDCAPMAEHHGIIRRSPFALYVKWYGWGLAAEAGATAHE